MKLGQKAVIAWQTWLNVYMGVGENRHGERACNCKETVRKC